MKVSDIVQKVISGGQTGIDEAALNIAHQLGYTTGGYAPKDFKTERGPNFLLRTTYGLVECESSSYPIRTKLNIQHSDLTIVFGNLNSPGSKQTITLCKQCQKPCLENPSVEEAIAYIQEHKPAIVNFAGNRMSKLSNLDWNIYSNRIIKILSTNNYENLF